MNREVVDNRKLLDKLIYWHGNKIGLVYSFSVIHRSKDTVNSKTDAIKDNKMLDFYFLSNQESNFEYRYNKILSKSIELCNNTNSRLYLKVAPRTCLTFNSSLIRYIAGKENTNFDYKHFTKSTFDSCVPLERKIVLDLDNVGLNDVYVIQNAIVQNLVKTYRYTNERDVVVVPTFNGYHIVTVGFDPRLLMELKEENKYNFNENTYKPDADTLIYGVREVED